jgi:hypothetical protein
MSSPDASKLRKQNAAELLLRVNRLLDFAKKAHISIGVDKDTGTMISGSRNGSGDGGFRLATTKTGAARSRHKEGQAVDVYDPDNRLDNFLTDAILEQFKLYREHPHKTLGWCHLQSVPPRSELRTFNP